MTTANATMSLTVPPNGTGLVDTAPGIAMPRVVDDDPIATTEEALRKMALAHAEEEMRLAMSLLEHGPAAASRALHLVEGMANIHAQVLVLLGLGAKRPGRRRRDAVQVGSPAYYDYIDDIAAEASMGAVDAQLGGETYGNNVVQQLIAMFKPLIKEGGLFGMAARVAEKPVTGMDIMSLTNALAEAKRSKLSKDVVDSITKKLLEALDGKAPEPTLIGQPIEAGEVVESEAFQREEVGA